jgi:hypothetical protein
VFRARDTKLNRRVAIKAQPASSSCSAAGSGAGTAEAVPYVRGDWRALREAEVPTHVEQFETKAAQDVMAAVARELRTP